VADGIGSVELRSMGSRRVANRVCILKLLRSEGYCGRSKAGMQDAKRWCTPDMSHGNGSHYRGVAVLTMPMPARTLSPRIANVDSPTFLA
jgi:hypothetical protein